MLSRCIYIYRAWFPYFLRKKIPIYSSVETDKSKICMLCRSIGRIMPKRKKNHGLQEKFIVLSDLHSQRRRFGCFLKLTFWWKQTLIRLIALADYNRFINMFKERCKNKQQNAFFNYLCRLSGYRSLLKTIYITRVRWC